MRIVDDAEEWPLPSRVREETENAQTDEKPVRRSARTEAERRFESLLLRNLPWKNPRSRSLPSDNLPWKSLLYRYRPSSNLPRMSPRSIPLPDYSSARSRK